VRLFAAYTPGISEHRSTGSLFYANDALGSPRFMVNSSNAMTDDERFDAFGMTVFHGGQSPTTTPYGFVGKKGYQTDTSGLMLLGHRYYDAGIGRFLSRDPIHDGNNWYAYCGNNPLDKTDPSGESGIVQSITTDDMAMHDNIMENMDDLQGSRFMAGPVAGQSSVTTEAGAKEGIEAAKDAGEAGNTGIGKPGKIDIPSAKDVARQALKELKGTAEQVAKGLKAIKNATSREAIAVRREGERIIINITRAGHNGYQDFEHIIEPNGSRSVIQRGVNAAGKLEHYDPKYIP